MEPFNLSKARTSRFSIGSGFVASNLDCIEKDVKIVWFTPTVSLYISHYIINAIYFLCTDVDTHIFPCHHWIPVLS